MLSVCVLFLSLVKWKWPKDIKHKLSLNSYFSFIVTASSSCYGTVSAGREVAAACQHCICCHYYYYFSNVNWGDPSTPPPHSIILQPPDAAFIESAWMLTFGGDTKTSGKSRFDFTGSSAGSRVRLRLISDASWWNEKQRLAVGFRHFTKTQLSWERPKT